MRSKMFERKKIPRFLTPVLFRYFICVGNCTVIFFGVDFRSWSCCYFGGRTWNNTKNHWTKKLNNELVKLNYNKVVAGLMFEGRLEREEFRVVRKLFHWNWSFWISSKDIKTHLKINRTDNLSVFYLESNDEGWNKTPWPPHRNAQKYYVRLIDR